MEEHKFLVAELINWILKGLLSLLGIDTGEEVIPGHLIMAFLAALIIVVFFKLTVRRLNRFPTRMQYFLEILYQAFISIIDDVIGKEGRRFLPALATLGLFIAISNIIGLLPEMGSPTANLNVAAGCSLFIFVYYHMQGIKKHGWWGYIKTLMGPEWWLAPLFFPIELISHFSRPLSLSMRLFGNIFGEDLVIIIIATLLPFIAPVPMMAFAIFTSLLQAYIFVMLSAIYLSGAISEEH